MKDLSFQSFTWQHGLPILVIICITILLARWARGLKKESDQIIAGVIFSSLPLIAVLARMVMLHFRGSFSIQEDLPLHLCRLLAFFIPIAIWKKSRKWIAIFYFLILGGTAQAIITPDLKEGFPSPEYLIYWILHGILVAVPFFAIYVYRIQIYFKDLISAVIVANVYLIVIYAVNVFLGSNYFYTVHKPLNPSLLDYMGDWPWYILVGEVIGLILFLLAWLPFRWIKMGGRPQPIQ